MVCKGIHTDQIKMSSATEKFPPPNTTRVFDFFSHMKHTPWLTFTTPWVNQPGQLSLPSLQDQVNHSNPHNYINYEGGPMNGRPKLRVAVWPQGQSPVCMGLSLRPAGCTPA